MTAIDDLAGLLARVQRLERAAGVPQLVHSSIDDGALLETDGQGTVTSALGKQFDGTHTFAPITSSVPQTPTDPILEPRPGGLLVVWDGHFLDDDVVRMDFARVEVHVSITPGFTPSRLTLAHVFDSPQGGEVLLARDVLEHHVALVNRTQAGVGSTPSGEVAATPLPAAELSPEQVEAIVDDVLAQIPTGSGNLITYATVEPNVDGTTDGDTWWQLDAGNVVGLWRWEVVDEIGSWVAQTLGDAVLAGIEAGKITTGTLAAGQTITVGNPAGAHVDLGDLGSGDFGLRKYAADGVTPDVDLTGDTAVFSGIVAGSEVIGGDIYTALAGPRVHIKSGSTASHLDLVDETIGYLYSLGGYDYTSIEGSSVDLISGNDQEVEPGTLSVNNTEFGVHAPAWDPDYEEDNWISSVVLGGSKLDADGGVPNLQLHTYWHTVTDGSGTTTSRRTWSYLLADEAFVLAESLAMPTDIRYVERDPAGTRGKDVARGLPILRTTNFDSRADVESAYVDAVEEPSIHRPLLLWNGDTSRLECNAGSGWSPVGQGIASIDGVPPTNGNVDLGTRVELRRNVLRNPLPASTTAWTTVSSDSVTRTWSFVNTAGAGPEGSTGFARLTFTGSTTGEPDLTVRGETSDPLFPLPATLRARVWVRSNAERVVRPLAGMSGNEDFTLPANTWTLIEVVKTWEPVTPGGSFTPHLNLEFRDQNWTVGDTIDVAQAVLEVKALGEPFAEDTSYFDGSSPGARWVGTANNSASVIERLGYVLAEDAEVPITLAAGFEVVPGTGSITARRKNGFVFLSGLIRQTGGAAMSASTLYTPIAAGGIPDGFRPSQTEWMTGGTTTGQDASTVVVLATGAVQYRIGPTNVSYVGLGTSRYIGAV